jgi:hypothetical protein
MIESLNNFLMRPVKYINIFLKGDRSFFVDFDLEGVIPLGIPFLCNQNLTISQSS